MSNEESERRVRMLNAMMGGKSIAQVMADEQKRATPAPAPAPTPKKSDTLEDRMKAILQTSTATKKATDNGELPAGFQEFAAKQGMSVDEQAKFLAFQNRIAGGNIKLAMHGDGHGMDITFH